MNRFLLVLALTLPHFMFAQIGFNSPAEVTPVQDFEGYSRNGFLIQAKYRFVTADPNTSINTMNCANPNPVPILTALAGILKDPSGDGNYTGGVSYSCTQSINLSSSVSGTAVVGIELVFDDFDTETGGDYVRIVDFLGREQTYWGSTPPARIVVPNNTVIIRFVTNNNAVVGRGFRLRWRALLDETRPAVAPITFGRAMQFNLFKGSFQVGGNNTGIGDYSSALGFQNTASGLATSTLGFQNTASGSVASALGAFNTASGDYSSALGFQNTTSGDHSIALGRSNTASGNYSSALGRLMNTNFQQGTFMVGDSDPLNQGVTLSGVDDRFFARFLNGYYLLTSGDNNPGSGFGAVRTGVQIGRGQTSWATISDSTKKERLRPIDHTDLLQKINAMRLSTWNYKGQHSIRHYGPMAQDFYAAFGNDGLGQVGCDTLIYSHDFAGVTFAGVQALIRENIQLKIETQNLASLLDRTNQKNVQLQTDVADLRSRMELLEKHWLRGQTKRTVARAKR